MGRRASKANRNIYYLARMQAAEKDPVFSSREGASDNLRIERSRLARIELDKIQPYPEEILIMAKAYGAPYLCGDYCKNVCPIGINNMLGEKIKGLKKDSFERLSLRFISSAHSVEDISRKLVDISKDGKVTEEEYESFHKVLKAMDELAENIREIKAYIIDDPVLRSRFEGDLSI